MVKVVRLQHCTTPEQNLGASFYLSLHRPWLNPSTHLRWTGWSPEVEPINNPCCSPRTVFLGHHHPSTFLPENSLPKPIPQISRQAVVALKPKRSVCCSMVPAAMEQTWGCGRNETAARSFAMPQGQVLYCCAAVSDYAALL